LFYILLQVLRKSQEVSHTVPFHIARGLNNGSKYVAPPGLNTLNIEHLLKHGKMFSVLYIGTIYKNLTCIY
jgi:hypothetical protein